MLFMVNSVAGKPHCTFSTAVRAAKDPHPQLPGSGQRPIGVNYKDASGGLRGVALKNPHQGVAPWTRRLRTNRIVYFITYLNYYNFNDFTLLKGSGGQFRRKAKLGTALLGGSCRPRARTARVKSFPPAGSGAAPGVVGTGRHKRKG